MQNVLHHEAITTTAQHFQPDKLEISNHRTTTVKKIVISKKFQIPYYLTCKYGTACIQVNLSENGDRDLLLAVLYKGRVFVIFHPTKVSN